MDGVGTFGTLVMASLLPAPLTPISGKTSRTASAKEQALRHFTSGP